MLCEYCDRPECPCITDPAAVREARRWVAKRHREAVARAAATDAYRALRAAIAARHAA